MLAVLSAGPFGSHAWAALRDGSSLQHTQSHIANGTAMDYCSNLGKKRKVCIARLNKM